MCGIIGYNGERKASKILFKCLKELSYRGYDSVGIATLNGNKICIKKDKGKIEEVHSKLNFLSLSGNIGIGHTRWATHGVPSMRNAHPHIDCKGKISVVHNGVIENYAELKKELEKKGHNFISETDSEVIPHLIEEEIKGAGVEKGVKNAINRLIGSYALVIMISPIKKLWIARKYSPLIIGIGEKETFCASDIPTLLPYTRNFIVLEDGEIGEITPSTISIEKDGKRVDKKPMIVKWSSEMARKGGYKYFTLKEINEQPKAIIETLSGEIKRGAELIKKFNRIEVIGCGTSFHAGLIFKHTLQRLLGIPCDAIIASEYPYISITDKKTGVVAISQSGETADTLQAVRIAKKNGAKVLALVNVLGSSLCREADEVIYTHAGPELSVVSTKAFTAQVAALSHVIFSISKSKELIDELKGVPKIVENVLKMNKRIEKLANELRSKNDFFFIGRSISYPTAMEGALKLKEISYAHAEAYPAGELKHGPLSLLEKGVPVIGIAPDDETKMRMLNNIKECKARDALTIGLSNSKEILEEVNIQIPMPNINPLLTPILYIIPLQLLAYHISVLRGNDPDKPRNLAKSVTVE